MNSGTDNTKRGDIKNASSIELGANKVIFYEIECTADDVSLNDSDKKFGYTATITAFDSKAVVNEQVVKKGSQTVNSTHMLVYFDLSTTNANTAYFTGDSGNKFTDDQKNSYKTALIAATDVTISSPNFTLIGSAATNFKIYKMGSAKSVNALLAEYGISPIYNVTKDLCYDNNALYTAVSAAASGDEIELNGAVEIGNRVDNTGTGENVKTINITVGSGKNVTITRKSGYEGLLFLNRNSSDNKMYIDGSAGSLTIDNNAAANIMFELRESSTLSLKNVTIQNSTARVIDGHSGPIMLDNVTFKSCKPATASNVESQNGDVNYQTKAVVTFRGNNLTMLNNNQFIDCGDEHIYLDDTNSEAATKIKAKNDDNTVFATHTRPIVLSLPGNRTVGTSKWIVSRGYGKSFPCVFYNEGYYATTNGNNTDLFAVKVDGPTYDLTISSAGLSTLVLPFNVATLPSGVTAYKLTTTNSVVSANEVSSITKDEPVLIKAEAGTYTFTGDAAASYTSGTHQSGALIGTYTAVSAATGEYVLQNGAEGVGFYRLAETSNCIISPFRAYLSSAETANARSLTIVFEDETTSINTVLNEEQKTNSYYDLGGRHVDNPTKGLYIVNGKKVFVK